MLLFSLCALCRFKDLGCRFLKILDFALNLKMLFVYIHLSVVPSFGSFLPELNKWKKMDDKSLELCAFLCFSDSQITVNWLN